jgi:polyhydroxybutyrate depolymerase
MRSHVVLVFLFLLTPFVTSQTAEARQVTLCAECGPSTYRRVMPSGPFAGRTYLIHGQLGWIEAWNLLPPATRTPDRAVVLNFHPYSVDAVWQEANTGMSGKSDAVGFYAVYPQGVGNKWDAGPCCAPGQASGAADVNYVEAVINDVKGFLPNIDRQRVYATGFSNGGFMAYRLACELSGKIAAVAPVAASMGIGYSCNPTRPVPVIHFHGSSDTFVPYGGGSSAGLASWYGWNISFEVVPTVTSAWATRNGCAPAGAYRIASSNGIDTTCYDAVQPSNYSLSCEATKLVTLCVTNGGGHSWPNGGGVTPGTPYLNANDLMWTKFSPLRAPTAP